MNTLQTTTFEKVTIVRLDRGKANAMNAEMVAELIACFKQLGTDPLTGAVVLTGKSPFFSAGLDVIELYSYDEQQIISFWKAFRELVITLCAFPKPLICGISGHSPAGGCVLALCCDYRIMADGNFRVGLNEVPVGILVPDPIFQVYSFWIGKRKAYKFLLEGTLLLPGDALTVGLLDEVCAPEAVEELAVRKARQYLVFNADVWSGSKLNFRKSLIKRLSADFENDFAPTLRQWWSAETRKGLGQMIAGLKSK